MRQFVRWQSFLQGGRMHMKTPSLIVVLASVLTGCQWTDMSVNEYPTLAAAEADGAVARGWLPSLIPASATVIHEAHNVDTNARWLSFLAPEQELRALAPQLTPLSYGDVRSVAPRAPRVAGIEWPPELGSGFQHTPRAGISYFRDTSHSYCYALEWSAGRAWGWSCETPTPSAT